MLKVYCAPDSIYSRKVVAVLEEKGLDYEIALVRLGAKEHQTKEFLKMNPNGQVPVLTDDAFTVYESTAIIEYLNDEYPEPPLLPEDSEGRARARIIEDFCDLHLFPALSAAAAKKLAGAELSQNAQSEISDALARIADYLGERSFVAGAFSLADCAVTAALASLEHAGLEDLAPASLKSYFSVLKTRAGFKGARKLSSEPAATEAPAAGQ